MKYVIGIDLGTSAVKILLVDQNGNVIQGITKQFTLLQEKPGYSEQHPEDWVEQTIAGLGELIEKFPGSKDAIEGISFSGQMHGLVLLDENKNVLRPAILWNDTRTTAQCEEIYRLVGEKRLLDITKNPALQGFTLPKLLWVKQHEPEIYAQAKTFVLPKDYVRYRLTGALHMDYSDAAGTLLLDIANKKWSTELCDVLGIEASLCPPLVASSDEVGTLLRKASALTGLSSATRVFAGGADNACGAIGAGVLSEGKTLCSIGTSGVVLSYEAQADKEFGGKVHYFNHGSPDAYYTMGVTLAAGHSLSWFKNVFAEGVSFEELLAEIATVPVGSNGLLFTPYISGERSPHADAMIRGSFIGMDSRHKRKDFVRAVMEGITFSLNESLELFRESGKTVDTVISSGGGSKNEAWLQMQADIFQATIVKLSNEQGPGMGAAMLAAYGCGWFASLQDCADSFLETDKIYKPKAENVAKYKELFAIYQDVYGQTKKLNDRLNVYRM
ncbi:xylulokinase [Oceanobacillus picturae]|uniref:xylulokinase n=1 Tax=Oceanobacillus picturae TaxID=171693 RepID=UPI000E69C630|nr:xylulokinase [Oceanobacillus picturae]RIU94822.1 xylulokinase [Oceanobacillus picturae]